MPKITDAASIGVMTEVDNPTTEGTSISNSDTDSTDYAFAAIKAGQGSGLRGESGSGPGTVGQSIDTTDPEANPANAGVVGIAGAGGTADNFAVTGVYGFAASTSVPGFVGSGVWGDSPDVGVAGTGSIGVEGIGGWGVLGYGGGIANAVGLYGAQEFPSGRALYVEGRAEFTRSGRATVVSGASSKVVSLAGVTPSSLAFAVMNTSEPSRWVRAVVPGTGKFTVYFNAALQSSAAIVWIVFTNPSNHSG